MSGPWVQRSSATPGNPLMGLLAVAGLRVHTLDLLREEASAARMKNPGRLGRISWCRDAGEH